MAIVFKIDPDESPAQVMARIRRLPPDELLAAYMQLRDTVIALATDLLDTAPDVELLPPGCEAGTWRSMGVGELANVEA